MWEWNGGQREGKRDGTEEDGGDGGWGAEGGNTGNGSGRVQRWGKQPSQTYEFVNAYSVVVVLWKGGRVGRGEVDTGAVIVVMGGAVQVDDGRTWKVSFQNNPMFDVVSIVSVLDSCLVIDVCFASAL